MIYEGQGLLHIQGHNEKCLTGIYGSAYKLWGAFCFITGQSIKYYIFHHVTNVKIRRMNVCVHA